MAQNPGIAPPDPSTPVGQVRLLSGDIDYTPLTPPVAGEGNYSLWSDDQIEAALALAGDSIPRAIAIMYMQMAAAWNSSSATIRTDDLQYQVKDSVGSWLSLADYWNKVADSEEERAINDYFDMVPVGTTRLGRRPPEASPWPVCHCGGGCGGECWW